MHSQNYKRGSNLFFASAVCVFSTWWQHACVPAHHPVVACGEIFAVHIYAVPKGSEISGLELERKLGFPSLWLPSLAPEQFLEQGRRASQQAPCEICPSEQMRQYVCYSECQHRI